MWKTCNKFISPIIHHSAKLLTAENVVQSQIRTTFVLKRKYPPRLHKQGAMPKPLKRKNFIYEFVKDTNVEFEPDMEVILTSYVEGLGHAGDKVAIRPSIAYNKLLLPGLAVYASPENMEKYKNIEKTVQKEHSSPTSPYTINALSRMTISIIVNKDQPWTLKQWHIRTAFRRNGFMVPEETITMPSKPISGPDMSLENKEFYVTVKINNFEEVKVKCRIHHWSTEAQNRIIHVHDYWKIPGEPIFPEDGPVLAAMPRPDYSSEK